MEIQDRAFQGLDQLHELNLYANNINKIKNTMFDGITNLKILDLSYNYIDNLDSNTFEYLVNLNILYLNNNYFDKIEKTMLNNLLNLRILNFISNYISEIGNNSFSALINLKKLYLSNNNLTILHNKTFFNLVKISELHITYNNIRYLDLNCFINTPNLKILKASHNGIISLSGNLLKLTSLKHLYLNNNAISSISSIGLVEYLSANNSIYLKNNLVNISIDCENKWILENYQNMSFNFHSNNLYLTWKFTNNNNNDYIDVNNFNAHCLFQYINNKESCAYLIEIFKNYSMLCNKGKLVYWKKYILLFKIKYF